MQLRKWRQAHLLISLGESVSIIAQLRKNTFFTEEKSIIVLICFKSSTLSALLLHGANKMYWLTQSKTFAVICSKFKSMFVSSVKAVIPALNAVCGGNNSFQAVVQKGKSPRGVWAASSMPNKPSVCWAVAMFIHVSAISSSISDHRSFSDSSSLRNRRVGGGIDASHGSKRRLLRIYLGAGKLFYSINLCTEPAAPVNVKINRCSFFCLEQLWMMDYRTQIAVIIGKPLTFRHYPYPHTPPVWSFGHGI